MLRLKEYQDRPAQLADYLPWACLCAPGIVLNKDGSFQRTVRYRGPDLDSAIESELIVAHSRINNVLRRFGSGWALFFQADRHETRDYPHGDFPDGASWLVDQERRLRFEEERTHFESAYFLTFLWLPPADATGSAERALMERPERVEGAHWRERLTAFIAQTDRAIDLLSTALVEVTPLSDGETLTYLHACVSTKRHPVSVPDLPVFIDALLVDEPFSGGLEPMLGDEHLRTLTILGFPTTTLPGLLDELNRLGFAYRWTTRFLAVDKSQAEAVLRRHRRQWFAKRKSISAVIKEVMFNEASVLLDTDANNKTADAEAALEELGADLVSFGYVTTTITVCDSDRASAEEQARTIERVINARGFTAIRETLNAVEAWLGSLPGHVYANIRRPILHTLNLAHMTPLSAVWAGDEINGHLNAPALLHARTDGATPFRLNLHVGDVGHTLVIGPTGAGKSVLLALLALQWRRYSNAQIFLFDKGRSARAAILAMGGVHLDIGREHSLAFQPLARIDQDAERAFALDWTVGLLGKEGIAPDPEVKDAVWSALRSLSSAPPHERTLTGLSVLLQSNRVKQALQPYTLDGPHGRLLDADEDRLALTDVQCFEMEELMHSPALVAPVLTYLFHRLEARFDGRPTLLIIDEAWVFLDDALFAGRIREWLKTLRKRNVAVLFATQSLADVTASTIAPAIIESCPTRIFLPNERAHEPHQRDTYVRFGLNERQIEIIAGATPKQDYYLQSPKGARLFELALGPVALALCGAGTPGDHKLIDRVLTEVGLQEFPVRFLNEKGLSWASDLLVTRQGKGDAP